MKKLTIEQIKNVFSNLFKTEGPLVSHYEDDKISCFTIKISPTKGRRGITIITGNTGMKMIEDAMKKEMENNYKLPEIKLEFSKEHEDLLLNYGHKVTLANGEIYCSHDSMWYQYNNDSTFSPLKYIDMPEPLQQVFIEEAIERLHEACIIEESKNLLNKEDIESLGWYLDSVYPDGTFLFTIKNNYVYELIFKDTSTNITITEIREIHPNEYVKDRIVRIKLKNKRELRVLMIQLGINDNIK